MRVVVVAREEVRVVRRDDRQAELVGELEDALVELRLALGVVRLHLEVVAVLEDVGVPRRGLARAARRRRPCRCVRDLARQARGGDDRALRCTWRAARGRRAAWRRSPRCRRATRA